jgi:hypothetical protein
VHGTLLLAGSGNGSLQNQHDFRQDVEEAMSPKLAWIVNERIRAGYNYNASLEWYLIAMECGMNTIFSRLEIANEPSGDVDLLKTISPGERKPEALRSYELIKPSSRRAKELGLHWFYMLNLAASRGNYDDGMRNNSRRYNNGRLFAPTDEIYWTRVVENRFLRVAKMLRGNEFAIDRFLIDPEMYALGGATPPDLDFGDYAFGEFLKKMGLKFKFHHLTIRGRQEWMEKKGLKEELRRFQFDRIKVMAERTRERVQAIHPDALLGFFLWRPSFWFQAVAAGFSTPRTPCLVGPESTYSGEYDDHFLAYHNRVRQEAGIPVLFVPGLALSAAESPEILNAQGRNLYHRSIRTQGYWFWSLGRAFGNIEKRESTRQLLATVNAELDQHLESQGKYESPLKPAPIPADVPSHLQDTLLSARSWVRIPETALAADVPPPTSMQLRGLHTFVFRAKKGDEVKFDVKNIQLGQYISPTSVKTFRPDASEIHFASIPLSQSQQIVVKADKPGNWVFAVTSGKTVGNAFRIYADAPNVVLYSPGGSIRGCRGGKAEFRYFFYVPRGIKRFHLKMAASVNETATFRLFGADGRQILEEKNLSKSLRREINATTHAGRVCWLETTDIVEDHSFGLVGIPNIFAWHPDQLLAPNY